MTTDSAVTWRYSKPPNSVTVMLLTVGGIATKGKWEGEYGEHFKAWFPLPKRDKLKELELGFIEKETKKCKLKS